MNNKQKYVKKSVSYPCVTLTGMPGSGKSTIGRELAKLLDWSFMDTDMLLEALYESRLQDITDIFGKEKFLKVEGCVLSAIDASKCVIATGGSVIYSRAAMEHLLKMGPLIYLELSLREMEKRILENPERGIAIAPGQSLADLYNERVELYKQSASYTVNTEKNSVENATAAIAAFLEPWVRRI